MRTRISQRQFKIIVEMLSNMNKKRQDTLYLDPYVRDRYLSLTKPETTIKDNKRFIPISPFDKQKKETTLTKDFQNFPPYLP